MQSSPCHPFLPFCKYRTNNLATQWYLISLDLLQTFIISMINFITDVHFPEPYYCLGVLSFVFCPLFSILSLRASSRSRTNTLSFPNKFSLDVFHKSADNYHTHIMKAKQCPMGLRTNFGHIYYNPYYLRIEFPANISLHRWILNAYNTNDLEFNNFLCFYPFCRCSSVSLR